MSLKYEPSLHVTRAKELIDVSENWEVCPPLSTWRDAVGFVNLMKLPLSSSLLLSSLELSDTQVYEP